MTTRGMDEILEIEILEMALYDLDKGENKEAAAAFIRRYIKYLKKNIRLAYKVGLNDLFNAACDSDDLDYINDKMFELKDKADRVDIDELLNGLNCEEDE